MSGSDQEGRLDDRLRRHVAGALRVLAVDPPVARRPVPALRASRRRRALVPALAAVLVLAATAGALAAYDRGGHVRRIPVAEASASPWAGALAHGSQPMQGTPGSRGAGGVMVVPSLAPQRGVMEPQCESGRNGGATAVGVAANRIQLATTLALSGVMAPAGQQTEYGMLAELNVVNRGGGVCGREIALSVQDDGGDTARGRQAIDADITRGQTFAVVMPSPPGLSAASAAGDLDRAGMPVVGYDATELPPLDDPWAWPVLSPEVSLARAVAHDAWRRGAHTYAFVYDSSRPNAAAIAGAFRAQVQRDGGVLDSSCLIRVSGGSAGLSSPYQAFQQSCGSGRSGGGVDFVGFAFGAAAQQQWASDAQSDPRAYWGVRGDGSGEGAGAASGFEQTTDLGTCGSWCGHVWTWGSSVPDDAPFSAGAPMQDFARTCAMVSESCDPHDPHAQAGYAAMQLMVAALQDVGPVLTRRAVHDYLDGATFDDGVLLPLHYGAATHLGVQEMRPVVAITFDRSGNPQSFAWAAPMLTDPCPGCGDPAAS